MNTLLLIAAASLAPQTDATAAPRGPLPTLPPQAHDVRRVPSPELLEPFRRAAAATAGPARSSAPRASSSERERPPMNPAVFEGLEADVHHDVEDGVRWAMGRSWKASFSEKGATFIPFLGSDAPRNFPLTFRVDQVEQGGAIAALEGPQVDREGERLRIDRGPVRAEYVTSRDGVEQLFVFDAPLGDGDLELVVDYESELDPTPDGDGWRFDGPHGGVDYGAAFVIDAAGERLNLETHVDDGSLRFVVPAAFLAEASWPVAVDPFLSSSIVDDDAKDQREVDVAYDPTTERYVVVFEEAFSASDGDVKTWALTAGGNVVPFSARYVNFASQDCRRPRIACTQADREFLVVYTLQFSGVPSAIRARSRNCDTSNLGSTFVVDDQTASQRDHADVCGDTYFDGTLANFVIVWQRTWDPTDSDIVVRAVNPDGTLISGEVLVTNLVGIRDEQPTISNTITPNQAQAHIAWRRFDGTTNLSQILGASVRYDAGQIGGPFSLSGTTPQRYSNPAITGIVADEWGTTGFSGAVAVWQRDFISDHDIVGSTFVAPTDNSFLRVSRVQNVTAMEHVDLFLDQREPSLAVVDDRVLLSYSSEYPGASDYVIRTTTINLVDEEFGLTEAHGGLDLSSDETFTPRVTSRYENGDATSSEAMTLYARAANSSAQADIRAVRHVPYAGRAVGQQVEFCIGEVNSSNWRSYVFAEAVPGAASTVRLQAERVPTGANGFFLASRVAGSGVIPGGSQGRICLGGSIGRYSSSVLTANVNGRFTLDIDLNAISQPTGPVIGMAGETWYFQAWHRDVTSGPPTSNFTNAVAVPIL